VSLGLRKYVPSNPPQEWSYEFQSSKIGKRSERFERENNQKYYI
jgi:hypothetical protein